MNETIDSATEAKIHEAAERFKKSCREFVMRKLWGAVEVKMPFDDGKPQTERLTKVETYK